MSRTASGAARVLGVLKALKGHTVTGLSNTELAQLTKDSPSNIT
ncbi:IclR family transcriptional regulator, partial [Pseudomonas gessardii]|nr:IclR family transcriptional regulator [Pseudomonas gessardii]